MKPLALGAAVSAFIFIKYHYSMLFEIVFYGLAPRTQRPGLHVLDLGCGPGTISMGLAKAVEPDEFHDIDI